MKKIIFLILISLTARAQWTQSNFPTSQPVYHIGTNAGNTFAFGGNTLSTWLSPNGTVWVNLNVTPGGIRVYGTAYSGSNFFASTQTGVYLSTDNGSSWAPRNNGLGNLATGPLYISVSSIFVGTAGGIYISNNNGNSWSLSGLNNLSVNAITSSGSAVFAGLLNSGGIYVSTNNGGTWTLKINGLTDVNIYSMAAIGSTVFAGTGSFLFKTTDTGNNWIQVPGVPQNRISHLAVTGSSIFANTYVPPLSSGGIFLSNNGGDNWINIIDSTLTCSSCATMTMGLNSGYVMTVPTNSSGTTYFGIWIRSLSELIGIQPISTEVPNQFSLSQNYPNPFNPTTKIRFAVLLVSQTFLSVYDLLGREVAALINEQLQPGTYEVDWSADKFSSGVYYYKLTAGDYTETRKMVLIK